MKKLQRRLDSWSTAVETVIGLFVLLACIIGGSGVLFNQNGPSLFLNPEYFMDWISIVCYFLIGIEFVKMIATHSVEAVVDILLVALSRQMLVDHPAALDTLFIIVAVAILFVVRKYLFVVKAEKGTKEE